MTVRRFLPALGLALSLLSPAFSRAQTQPPTEPSGSTLDSRLSEPAGQQHLGFSIAAEDAPVCVSGRLQPVALLASLGPGLNASNDGTAIRFTFTGSGLKLLTDATFGYDTLSDESGGTFRGMHLSLKPAILAAGRRPLLSTTAWRYSFYNPEMNLLAESELRTTAGTPLILYEYVWFNGHPVAQVDAGTVSHWTFTDHLGTPLIQTDSGGNTYWRAEHEPYGEVFALRTVDQHQPLRLPGQEAEKLEPVNPGPNGATERSYNIFRWYRSGWGRYTQPDPANMAWQIHPVPYAYADSRPTKRIDRIGLYTIDSSCGQGQFAGQVTQGVSDVCARTKPGTRCSEALKNVSAALGGGSDLPGCFHGLCGGTKPATLHCDPCFKYNGGFPCAATWASLGGTSTTIGGGNSGCPANRGLGYGETIFHESLHICAFRDEPDDATTAASWFRYLEHACYGWRDPGAPPIGPPRSRP